MENLIKELRKANNMTQEELAKKIGISPSYLSKIENGKKQGTYRKIRIYEIFGSRQIDEIKNLFFEKKYNESKKNNIKNQK